MTNHPFRFIHAADLHLESPITGLSFVPEHLRPMVLDAPREAAARVFEEALSEKVDFVLLSGDILAPTQTGAWGPLFLLEQFEKLRMEGIPVFWACGKGDDPENWPDVFVLPDNVHRFSVDEPEEVFYRKEGIPYARILGLSLGKGNGSIRPADFPADPDGLYSIGVLYGKPSIDSLKAGGMQYWALGGEHRRETVSQTPSVIHYPGVNLARSPEDRDDCGVSLVEVNEFGRTVVRLIRTSPIAWATERIVVRGDEFKEEEILAEMRTRIRNLRKTTENVTLFLSWRFEVPTDMIPELRYGNLASTLLRDLRSDFGKEPPIVYSVDLEPAIPETFDTALYDQQTILGDFLRITHYYQENPDQAIPLSDFFPEDMKDYLENRLMIEKFKAKNSVISGGDKEETLPEELQTEKNFRGEIPNLIHLLTLSIDEWEGYRKTFNGQKEHRTGENLKRIARLRNEALKEAAALGTELLAGQPEEIRRQSAPTVRKDPRIEQERRGVLDYQEKKEKLS